MTKGGTISHVLYLDTHCPDMVSGIMCGMWRDKESAQNAAMTPTTTKGAVKEHVPKDETKTRDFVIQSHIEAFSWLSEGEV